MTIRNLEIFTKVAELGSMSAAAKTLYITQPSVSLAIAEIEHEYDVKLFDRTGNRLHLTPTGQQLLEYTTSILLQYKEMERFLKDESHSSSLRIGATVTVGQNIIAPIIEQLKVENPDIKCQVTVASTSIIEESLLKSELDVGFVEGDITSTALIVKPILTDEMRVICSPAHPFYMKPSIKLHELNGQTFILREEGSGTRARAEDILRENNITYHTQWNCASFGAIKEAVMHNLGITIISPRVVQRELADGNLWACKIEDASFQRTFDIAYRKNKFFTDSLLRFIEISHQFRNEDSLF